jgi:hypothetical protein
MFQSDPLLNFLCFDALQEIRRLLPPDARMALAFTSWKHYHSYCTWHRIEKIGKPQSMNAFLTAYLDDRLSNLPWLLERTHGLPRRSKYCMSQVINEFLNYDTKQRLEHFGFLVRHDPKLGMRESWMYEGLLGARIRQCEQLQHLFFDTDVPNSDEEVFQYLNKIQNPSADHRYSRFDYLKAVKRTLPFEWVFNLLIKRPEARRFCYELIMLLDKTVNVTPLFEFCAVFQPSEFQKNIVLNLIRAGFDYKSTNLSKRKQKIIRNVYWFMFTKKNIE